MMALKKKKILLWGSTLIVRFFSSPHNKEEKAWRQTHMFYQLKTQWVNEIQVILKPYFCKQNFGNIRLVILFSLIKS